MEQTIKAAMMHKTWIDAGREVLKDPAVRCSYYDAIFDMYFLQQCPVLPDTAAQAMLVMVRPYVIADRERYITKCEKNRANASGRKRTQADATNNNTNTSTNSNTNINNNNVSISDTKEREREIFDILGVFFYHEAANVKSEYQRFTDYYAALGWKNSKGASIVSKRHAARQWEIQVKRHANPNYDAWYTAFCQSSELPPEVWTSISGIAVNNGTVAVITAAGGDFCDLLEQKCPTQLAKFVRLVNCTALEWRYPQK